MVSVGICVGSSTVTVARVRWNGSDPAVLTATASRHGCDPTPLVLEQLRDSPGDRICLTGRRLKERFALPAITEPEAIEYALGRLVDGQSFGALLSLGSENFILYELDAHKHITRVRTGSKCASGTGEFFLQQVGRMNVDAETAIRLAEGAEPFRVSGRCSVFCKSDCTHALNKGIEVSRVCAGLGDMLAEKVIDLARHVEGRIVVVGGVTRNRYVMGRIAKRMEIHVPPYAEAFEAVGAAFCAFERGLRHDGPALREAAAESFARLPPLSSAQALVSFHERSRGVLADGDLCVLGLDVGSTTTKAVLMRERDSAVLASVYLRTDGNPVAAARKCYGGILEQTAGRPLEITGVGVTGSGRHIAGLHAQSEGVINEIIAHATAAAFFDPHVDTILEIGGQDAKYTYLVNGVPCDYAMNEACSAGTGSFLEEAARESLDVDYRDIEGIAMTAQAPPNFNDQCAAFIASDIKSAAHERVSRADIVAGLVYSICMNYTNRVMGSRRIGNRVLMQGGVCYNRAVPLAMAALLQRPIVVPPDPGLMGAFGVALEIVHRMSLGLLARCRYDLRRLQDREVTHGRTFRCAGGSEKCDRGCTVNTLRIDGKTFPFGGACNRYYELRRRAGAAVGRNLVQARQDLLFASVPSSPPSADDGPTIGINRSFYMHTLYPLFSSFFSGLGLQVISSNGIDPAGASSVSSSFCFPTEIAHGAFANLLSLGPDYLFLPQIQEQFVENSGTTEPESHCSCVIGQAEPYYLRSVFRDIRSRIVSPVLNFSTGWSALVPQMASVATQVGATMAEGLAAAELAVEHQLEFGRARKEIGDRLLGELDRPDAPIAVVLFGRAYNAFPGEANLGIPQKFASRGVSVVPFDCLPTKAEESIDGMSWASGHEIIKAARFVKGHPRLFGCYITNFSCGPDSFLVGYFRDIMKTKPSLTLELDSHSADAGINTRVEAFLDIIERSVRIGVRDSHREPFVPARVEPGKRGFQFVCSDGKRVPLSVAEILIPSMGDITSRLGASALRGMGFSARHAPIPDFPVLMTGRKNTSCKECLPMILTTGTLLTELKDRPGSSPLVYFMPAQGGNCRFSQYTVFLQKLIAEKRLANVALWSLNSNNGYGGLSVPALLSILRSIIVSDCLDDIKNAVLALARDREKGMTVFEEALSRISRCMERGSRGLMRTLRGVARMLSSIELTGPLHQARTVLVAGEIYIRKDNFSSDVLVERLARRGIVCRRAPITEWLAYVDYYAQHLIRSGMSLSERVYLVGKKLIQARMERRIKKALAASGLCENEPVDIPALIRVGRRFVREELTGEIILVIGAFFREMIDHIHGLVSIGPFACLPSRVIESILSVESNVRNNERLKSLETYDAIRRFSSLPFLAVECDGNPFPPIIETRIEAFALQVERVHAQARESQDGRHRS